MLNFNVRHHRYRRDETWSFYNKQMAADYFRVWDGLYSRVLPIYSKPEEAGDYDVRSMYQRPKTRIPKQKKEDLIVTFYPEGGHLIQGVENRVAFEAVNQHGEAANITTNAMANLGKNESVPVETLEKICVVLGCTIDDIMDFEPDPVASLPREKKPGAKQSRLNK